MVLLYMVTFTINISPMLAYIPAPWILWVMGYTIVILNISGMVIIHEKSLLRRYKGTTFGSQQLSTPPWTSHGNLWRNSHVLFGSYVQFGSIWVVVESHVFFLKYNSCWLQSHVCRLETTNKWNTFCVGQSPIFPHQNPIRCWLRYCMWTSNYPLIV